MKYPSFLFVIAVCLTGFNSTREPMIADFKESASYRWLNKTVLDSRSLDDMENLEHWHSFTTAGGEVVDARKVIKIVDSSGSAATIELDKKKIHRGNTSMLMTTPTRLPGP